MFQFHFGTIGRLAGTTPARLLLKVSIPLWYDWELFVTEKKFPLVPVSIPLWYDWEKFELTVWLVPLVCFNSTLVRLGVLNCQWEIYAIWFQFHFGTIGSIIFLMLCISVELFQFHFGTIGSMIEVINNVGGWSFNSTLVRLGGSIVWSPCWLLLRFNSTLVRLGEYCRTLTEHLLTSFNSTLVRLGGQHERGRQPRGGVSIPLWYDWEFVLYLNGLSPFLVSIPLWYDWEVASLLMLVNFML